MYHFRRLVHCRLTLSSERSARVVEATILGAKCSPGLRSTMIGPGAVRCSHWLLYFLLLSRFMHSCFLYASFYYFLLRVLSSPLALLVHWSCALVRVARHSLDPPFGSLSPNLAPKRAHVGRPLKRSSGWPLHIPQFSPVSGRILQL